MRQEYIAKSIEDIILDYLGMTRDELEQKEREAQVQEEYSTPRFVRVIAPKFTDELEDWVDGTVDEDEAETEYTGDEDQCEDEVEATTARMELLGDIIDDTLLKLDEGYIEFENAQEMIATIQAVSMYEELVRKF